MGLQGEDQRLDLAGLATLTKQATGMGKTLHRVIDVVPDPLKALDQAIELGFERVLTSGAAPLAPDGLDMIAAMVRCADGRISIMPGCGLAPENVTHVIKTAGVTEVHAACNVPVGGDPAFSDFDPAGGRRTTSSLDVARMRSALDTL